MFYHYKGSLTTPPCAETVEWFVITEIYEISRKNFEKIKAAINGGKGNSRQVQTLNGRRPMILGRFCSIYRKFN
jgi:carbonic anhydrase